MEVNSSGKRQFFDRCMAGRLPVGPRRQYGGPERHGQERPPIRLRGRPIGGHTAPGILRQLAPNQHGLPTVVIGAGLWTPRLAVTTGRIRRTVPGAGRCISSGCMNERCAKWASRKLSAAPGLRVDAAASTTSAICSRPPASSSARRHRPDHTYGASRAQPRQFSAMAPPGYSPPFGPGCAAVSSVMKPRAVRGPVRSGFT